MSILGKIFNRIFHRSDDDDGPAGADRRGAPGHAAPKHPPVMHAPGQPKAEIPATIAASAEEVDVEAALEKKAAEKGGGGNWRTSIVDLLKLLDLDSSLEARKELAEELNVHAGPHGSAEQNIALSRAVWAELEKNGGKVSPALKAA